MEYRKLGNTGMMVSAIGLGSEYVWFESERTIRDVIDTALDEGINYIDLFMGTPHTRYCIGKALKGRRDKVYLTGHLGCVDIRGQYVRTRNEPLCRKFMEDYFEIVGTDYVDVLFMHNCDQLEDLDGILNGWMYEYASELKAQGKARFIGLSSHNTRTAMAAVKSGKIDVLMFPVNPIFNMLPQDIGYNHMCGLGGWALREEDSAAYPTKQELYELCEKMGVGIVAMKPFAAGSILKGSRREHLGDILELTPVQLISYVLSFPQIGCPVPGVANAKQLKQVLAYFDASEEEKDFSIINDSMLSRFHNQCMYCNHCQPCPKLIDIAEVTKLADAAEKGLTPELRQRYAALRVNGADCIHCGACTRRCPFGIDAEANMLRAAKLFR